MKRRLVIIAMLTFADDGVNVLVMERRWEARTDSKWEVIKPGTASTNARRLTGSSGAMITTKFDARRGELPVRHRMNAEGFLGKDPQVLEIPLMQEG